MPKLKFILLSLLLQTGVFSACAQNNSAITILDSEEIRTEEHNWTLLSVEVRPDCTILEKMVSPRDEEKTWIASVRNEFIEDSITGEKFFIIDSEIGFNENTVILEGYKGRTFKEVYPALPKGTKYINVSSGSKYYLKSLDLSLDVSPAKLPISDIAFFGVRIGTDYKAAMKILKKQGFKAFYKEEEDGFWGGRELNTYLYKADDDYPITIQMVSDTRFNVVTEAEILYQNHIDMYEVNEHIQELADEVKAEYPYRTFEETTPDYQYAASMLDMKSGKDRIFKNVTIVIFRGYYYICNSSDDIKDDFFGTISFEVHDDNMHHDRVIRMRYADRKLSRIIRRSYGEYRW